MCQKSDEKETAEELKDQIKNLTVSLKKANRQIKRLEQERDFMAALNEQAYKMRNFYEAEYKQQFMYSSLILKNSPDILFIMDNDFKILLVTDSFLDVFKITSEDVESGIYLKDVLSDKLSEESFKELRERYRALETESGDYEKQITMDISGEKRMFDTHVIMLCQENFAGYVIAMSDVTEVVRAKEKAESADRAKSAFLANMSHEIRTPMNAITGMAEFIIRDSLDEEARENALQIKSASASLLVIINDILDFSKIEAGKMEMIPVEYQISSAIYDVTNMIGIRIAEKPVELVLDIDETMPYFLYGDEIRLRQIWMNILNNAVKFTERGSICMKMWYEREENSDEIIIYTSVKDSGIGIKPEDMDKLFSSFSQVDTTKNRSIEGTGLGLAISKRLAVMMGGDITVESEYGKGSTFTFWVRHRVLDEKPIGKLTKMDLASEKKAFVNGFTVPEAKILVVDDNLVNLRVAKGMLEPYGCRVSMASSGQEAIDISRAEKFDIIFMDHMMPVMDGVEAMERILKLPGRENSVIIALTANAIRGVREQYIKQGFRDFLAKPIDPEKMEKLLDLYLPDSLKRESDGKPVHNLIDDDILRQVYKDGLKKIGLLRELEEKKDYKNYVIEVHALKSVAAAIGENDLSERAKRHEFAGKDGNYSFIENDFNGLIKSYSKLIERLGKRFADETEKTVSALSEEECSALADSLREAVDEFDMTAAGDILNKLAGAETGERLEMIEKMRDAAEQFDYDTLEQLISQF